MKKNIKIFLLLFLIMITISFIPNKQGNTIISKIIKYKEPDVPVDVKTEYNKMFDIENLIGRYQFNYTGASNAFYQASPGTNDSGFSHLPELAEYENDEEWASSSGAYIDKKHNIIDGTEGTVKKAYLVFELSGMLDVYNYPSTIVYGGEDGIPKISKEIYVTDFMYKAENNIANDIGYIDITDFFNENGYGWYYMCNIPYKKQTDTSADWKIVLIEENEKLPVRMMRLQFGAKIAPTSGPLQYLSLEGDGIVTKKSGNVTGQFLYNITNVDGKNCGVVQIATGDEDDITTYEYQNIVSTNGIRTASTPLYFQKTLNTTPINFKTNYTKNYYFGNNLFNGADVELLEIDGTTDKHNITFPNNKKKVAIRYKGGSYTLVVNMLGMAADIDVPTYESTQEAFLYDDDNGRVTIKGTTTSTASLSNIGLYDGQIRVEIDPSLEIDPETIKATFKDKDGVETTLASDMWTIEGNAIIFKFGKDAEARTFTGDSLSYEFKSMPASAISAYTIKNSVKSSGKLVATGSTEDETIDTDFQMDNVGWTTSLVDIPVQNDLYLDLNGGSYDEGDVTSYSGVKYHSVVEVKKPSAPSGKAFWKWELTSEENGASIIDKTHIKMGWSETNIKAIYFDDVNNNDVADIEEYRTIKYTDNVENEEVFPDFIKGELLDEDDTPKYTGSTARDGFVFAGWNPEVSLKVNGDVTYKAVWKEDINKNGIADEVETKYTVKYTDPDGYIEEEEYKNLLVNLNTPKYSKTPKREGYIFKQWAPDFKEKIEGSVIYTPIWLEDQNKNNIPDDEEEKYTIIYKDGLNGNLFDDKEITNLLIDTKTPAFSGSTQREGYVFGGWSPIFKEKVDGNQIYLATWLEDENKDGIADNTQERYTVKYSDGIGNNAFKEVVINNILPGMKTPKFEGQTPIRENYVFDGWNPNIDEVVSKNITYTAVWRSDKNNNGIDDNIEKHYTVKYVDSLSGKVIKESKDILVGLETPKIENLKDFDDYKFKGWSPNINEVVTDDIVYTSIWIEDKNKNDIDDNTEKHYKITFIDDEGGNIFKPITYEVVTGAKLPEFTPQKEGYKFIEWKNAKGTAEKQVSEDATYTPVWEKIDNQTVNNPKTGITLNIAKTILITLFSIIILKKLKAKNIFRKKIN